MHWLNKKISLATTVSRGLALKSPSYHYQIAVLLVQRSKIQCIRTTLEQIPFQEIFDFKWCETGGVLSPILFIDELLIRLQSQAVGCHWSHYFAGAFGYADDIVLLAPSASVLWMMLNTCCQFVTDYITASLSSLSSSSTPPIFMFGGQSLTLVDRASHLGHILHSDLSDTNDTLRVQSDIYATAFYLLFGHTLLSRPSCSALSVNLSMDLHCGIWYHLDCVLWK